MMPKFMITLRGRKSPLVVMIAGLSGAAAFRHLDGVFIGTTKDVHRLAINPGGGQHAL